MRDFVSSAICGIVSLVLLAIGIRYVRSVWIIGTVESLQLHLSIASVAALLLALSLRRAILPAALLAVALLFLAHSIWMPRDFAQAPITVAATDEPLLRLMSFNILMDNIDNGQVIAETILRSGADVVNIMEAEPLMAHLPALSVVYPYRIGCGEMTRRCDLMMLSKHPLLDPSVASLSNVFEERMLLARLDFGGRPLHVAAIHTTKPYFDNFQRYELHNAARRLNRIAGPLILSGDFNASSLASNVRGFLQDTGLRTAGREPATWPVEAGPIGVPIDHIFVRPPLGIAALQRLPDALGSNHFGLIAEIAVPTN
ncbi:MAG: endonuclease/exonuclease/phosphatase family protein [Alphaproteobacteria bacterium]|nr:endonuclease/exonuclease/phosphatase family protein [Alphaproteobacteria bacterium]MBU1550399.1 endonuclease/exonuclease/phosphatase family protein [Alphaproteobacteria bacterium]MBU2338535.1 endonuclease/exonuclease/phosphatase family protein [Alphaproteobacteria bacterium]MBU2389175.1 endonuclease/exonuclease/phosphatase family protein [Alphaproteobacteria bacterium]